MNSTTSVDSATAARIRGEWSTVSAAMKGFTGSEIQDPLGEDGMVTVKTNFFKANGGGEVVLLKGAAPGDHRFTRFRAWGPAGNDHIEKSSYLVKENGTTEFHKRRVEAGDQVVAADAMDAEDQAWANGLQ